ncbi:MAG: signal peptidase II [Clostridia bacterium]|nr:signal peptidase II [Clostridia bacterium]
MKTTTNNNLQSVKGRIITIAVALAAVLADQLSKIAAVKGLVRVGAGVEVIPGALNFTYVLNSGATAGMLSDKRWIFMAVSTVVIVAVSVYIALGKAKKYSFAIPLALILGGGIGNMIDRVFRGEVVDFIDVTLVDFFPFNTVFNVADMFVCVGCAILIIAVTVDEVKEAKSKKRAGAQAQEARDGE